jgi:hypothetical protein
MAVQKMQIVVQKAEPFDRRSQHHFLLASVHRCPKTTFARTARDGESRFQKL